MCCSYWILWNKWKWIIFNSWNSKSLWCAANLYAIFYFLSKIQKTHLFFFSLLDERVDWWNGYTKYINNANRIEPAFMDIKMMSIEYLTLFWFVKNSILNKYANKDACMYFNTCCQWKATSLPVCVSNTKKLTSGNVLLYCIIWANCYYFYITARLGQKVTIAHELYWQQLFYAHS